MSDDEDLLAKSDKADSELCVKEVESGCEIDLSKIPKGIKNIRFVN